ncbi:uncharacterized protein LOC116568536 [Mustela erminea]|uniref:uncharacterized protein LOC116568536 n=1 Tax=Mustela erminea TaxID=36723 RepID=UPI0013868016|nr:uncharacterized protein LOC116568536 [Mustela erminea]
MPLAVFTRRGVLPSDLSLRPFLSGGGGGRGPSWSCQTVPEIIASSFGNPASCGPARTLPMAQNRLPVPPASAGQCGAHGQGLGPSAQNPPLPAPTRREGAGAGFPSTHFLCHGPPCPFPRAPWLLGLTDPWTPRAGPRSRGLLSSCLRTWPRKEALERFLHPGGRSGQPDFPSTGRPASVDSHSWTPWLPGARTACTAPEPSTCLRSFCVRAHLRHLFRLPELRKTPRQTFRPRQADAVLGGRAAWGRGLDFVSKGSRVEAKTTFQETRPCPEAALGVLCLAPCASRTWAVRSGAAVTVGSAQTLAARILYFLSSFAPSQGAGSGAVWGPAASAPCAPRRCCEQTDLGVVRSGAATLPASSPGHPVRTGPGSLAQTGCASSLPRPQPPCHTHTTSHEAGSSPLLPGSARPCPSPPRAPDPVPARPQPSSARCR